MKNTTNFLTCLALVIFFPLSLSLCYSILSLDISIEIWDTFKIYIYIYIYIFWLLLWIVFIKFVVVWYCNFYLRIWITSWKKKKESLSFKKIGILLFFVLPMGKFSFWLEKVKLTLIREPMDRIWTNLLWKSKNIKQGWLNAFGGLRQKLILRL